MVEVLSFFVICSIFFACCWISYWVGREHQDSKFHRVVSERNKKIVELELALHEAMKNDKRDPKTGRYVK